MSEIKLNADKIAIKPGAIKIMVGDKVLQASSVKLHIDHDHEHSDHSVWEQPVSKIYEGELTVQNTGDAIRDILNDMNGKYDVIIKQELGKLPRKMKKALHSKRMTKWRCKVASYINRRQIRIRDAEMVVTIEQQETLQATISGGTTETRRVISGKPNMRKYGDPVEKELVLTKEQIKRLADIIKRPSKKGVNLGRIFDL